MGTLQEPEKTGKVKATIVLPRDLYRRIRRTMGISKRNLSAEIEYAMEHYVEDVEKAHGLSAKSLSDDNWPD